MRLGGFLQGSGCPLVGMAAKVAGRYAVTTHDSAVPGEKSQHADRRLPSLEVFEPQYWGLP